MTLTRRDFLKGAAATGAAAYVGVDLASGSDESRVFWVRLAQGEALLDNLIRPRPEFHLPAGEFIPAHSPVVIRDGRVFVYRYDTVQWRHPVRITGMRTDKRINRRLDRERGRLARGVRRYQGMRR